MLRPPLSIPGTLCVWPPAGQAPQTYAALPSRAAHANGRCVPWTCVARGVRGQPQGREQARGSLVCCLGREAAGLSRPAWSASRASIRGPWCFLSPGPEISLVSSSFQGSPSGTFLPGGLVRRLSLALVLLGRYHHQAEAQGRSGSLLRVCSGVSGRWVSCGAGLPCWKGEQ